MAADRRFVALRDVLVRGLRDMAVKVASLDLSDDEPSREAVEQYIQNLQDEVQKARERGVVVPPTIAIYADPRMLVAANRLALTSLKLRQPDGSDVFFAPPPAAYVMGTMAEEIERAAGEVTPTQELPTMDAVKAS